METNKILLRRKLSVYVPVEDYFDGMSYDTVSDYLSINSEDSGTLGALIANVNKLGFLFTPELISSLMLKGNRHIRELSTWLIPELKELVGSRDYSPMYPNFPKQVMEASDEELFINAILHYFGDVLGTRILPEYEKHPRDALGFDFSKQKPLRLCSLAERKNLLTNILTQRSSPSDVDKKDIVDLLNEGNEFYGEDIPNREYLAYFIKLIHSDKDKLKRYRRLVTTATDVLRIAVAMSDGDISLAEDSKFAKFCRQDRKFLLYLLNRIPPKFAKEDMVRYEQKWKRLGEKLHPGEYNEMFPEAYRCFDSLRNSKIRTYASRVEEAISMRDWEEVSNILKMRPGEFARGLSRMLRLCDEEIHFPIKVDESPDTHVILRSFESVIGKVASNILWTVYAHFKGHKHLEHKDRIFFPKGNTAKPIVGENHLPSIQENIQKVICTIIKKELVHRYSQKDVLGTVYVDPICKTLILPTSTRSASSQLRTVGRGSRFDVDTKYLRFFMWWKDQKNGGRVDLDLSAIIFDKDWKMIGRVNWTQLRSQAYNTLTNSVAYEGVHSGDITSAPNGACEFLDINIGNLRPQAAYVAMAVFSYMGQTFDTLQDSFAGFMCRDDKGNEGEVYEAPTVHTKFSLSTKSTSVCPLIFDVANKQVVWVDVTAHCNYLTGANFGGFPVLN